VVYSDGITEAINSEEDEFGLQRLEKLILENRNNSPQSLADKIVQEIRTYCGSTPQYDDLTLLIIKRSEAE
jgi:sigma-B regulation protein RsbU (phosphoserine phosphatase)